MNRSTPGLPVGAAGSSNNITTAFMLVSRHLAAAAAKSLQSCPTLCDPIDGSPPGCPVPGILQARVLEWVAIAFSTWSDEATANTLLLDVLKRDRKESFLFVHVGVVDGTETIIILLVLWIACTSSIFFSTPHYNQGYSLSLVK